VDDWNPKSLWAKVASSYDDVAHPDDTEQAVEFLAALTHGRPALELAVGTGRVAIPLASRGIQIDGIDFSPEMVARLKAKPGGADLSVTIGDIADVPVEEPYGLIFLVYNVLVNLTTQEAQVRCFQNVARHLTDDGAFVLEACVPEALWLSQRQHVEVRSVEPGAVTLDVSRVDPVKQFIDENHILLSEAGTRLDPVRTRYVWPSEMDLMARLGGLRLTERWGGWRREPFAAESTWHVSVYGKESSAAP
jgi:SAM-dependent methyltransferase